MAERLSGSCQLTTVYAAFAQHRKRHTGAELTCFLRKAGSEPVIKTSKTHTEHRVKFLWSVFGNKSCFLMSASSPTWGTTGRVKLCLFRWLGQTLEYMSTMVISLYLEEPYIPKKKKKTDTELQRRKRATTCSRLVMAERQTYIHALMHTSSSSHSSCDSLQPR